MYCPDALEREGRARAIWGLPVDSGTVAINSRPHVLRDFGKATPRPPGSVLVRGHVSVSNTVGHSVPPPLLG